MVAASVWDFNPRSPCGERRHSPGVPRRPHGFQSTLPLRGATPRQRVHTPPRRFQSTLPLRGATKLNLNILDALPISIHAPLAGSDAKDVAAIKEHRISIHAPLAGSDSVHLEGRYRVPDFNPRSPCGERLIGLDNYRKYCRISIHAPLAGSDPFNQAFMPSSSLFQSTLPLRGATVKQKNTESLRDSTYNFANLIKQVLWSTQNHY